jgi:hypothetical protein
MLAFDGRVFGPFNEQREPPRQRLPAAMREVRARDSGQATGVRDSEGSQDITRFQQWQDKVRGRDVVLFWYFV